MARRSFARRRGRAILHALPEFGSRRPRLRRLDLDVERNVAGFFEGQVDLKPFPGDERTFQVAQQDVIAAGLNTIFPPGGMSTFTRWRWFGTS